MNWQDLIEQVDWEVIPVDCDDIGDTNWKYYVVYKLNDRVVWNDYYRAEPSDTTLYNALLDTFKCDAFTLGDKYYSEWVEEQR